MNSAFIAIVEQARGRPWHTRDGGMSASSFGRRFAALLRKETRQLLRDRSNLAVGLLLPVLLILLFGYGLSFDVTNAPIAVVLEDRSPQARDVLAGLQGSPYIAPVWTAGMPEAVAADAARERFAASFAFRPTSPGNWHSGRRRMQLLLNGVDTNTAATIETLCVRRDRPLGRSDRPTATGRAGRRRRTSSWSSRACGSTKRRAAPGTWCRA